MRAVCCILGRYDIERTFLSILSRDRTRRMHYRRDTKTDGETKTMDSEFREETREEWRDARIREVRVRDGEILGTQLEEGNTVR